MEKQVDNQLTILQANHLAILEFLLAITIHGIKNSLGSLLLELELLEVNPFEKQINSITTAINSLQEYIHQKQQVMTSYHLNPCIEKTLKLCEHLFKPNYLSKYNALQSDFFISGNPYLLQQAIINIVIHFIRIVPKNDNVQFFLVTTKKKETAIQIILESPNIGLLLREKEDILPLFMIGIHVSCQIINAFKGLILSDHVDELIIQLPYNP